MIELIFNGKREDVSNETEQLRDFSEIESVEVYSVLPAARSADHRKTLRLGDHEVIEIEYENGIVDFLTEQELEEKANDNRWRGIEMPVSRGGGTRQVFLNDFIVVDGAQRGIGQLGIKFLRLFVKKKGIPLAVGSAAAKLDKRNVPDEGLFHCQKAWGELTDKVTSDRKLESAPYLLMIHGFASSITGSFDAFKNSGNTGWQEFWKMYNGRVLAFDHYTLTKSALENAVELVSAIPKNLTVDILSFSRGGLVAEIIVKAAEANLNEGNEDGFWSEAAKRLKDQPIEQQRLEKLLELVKSKNLKVRNFVRNACPAGGTTLASQRLVTYLKVVLNAIGMIPALRAFPPYEGLKQLIISIANQKDNTEVLPGIEVMNPASGYVKMINILGAEYPITKIPLHVVSGDVSFGNFWRTMSVILTDAFFLAKHDFVVDTRSMYQGFRRSFQLEDSNSPKQGFYYSYHEGPEVSHFNYMENKASLSAVITALKREQVESHFIWYDYGAKDLEYTLSRGVHDENRPTIILLPGIMGSSLKVGDKRVWVNFTRLVFGGIGDLSSDAKNVTAEGAVGLYYNKLISFLSMSHNVVVHGFDWRNDIVDSADLLNKTIEYELQRTSQSVKIVAHSMGGLVTHALYSKFPDTWEKLKSRSGFKAIFLGTPFRGSYAIINLYLKRHSVFNLLHKIDILNNSDDVLGIINNYIGMLQLLPAEAHFFEKPFWENMKRASGKGDDFIIPDTKTLKKASQILDVYNSRPIEGNELIYIAGFDSEFTPHRVEVNTLLQIIKVFGIPEGDGAVTWESGIPKQFEDRVWYTKIKHQNLCNKRSLFSGILDLLEKGTTSSTAFSTVPSSLRTAMGEYEMPTIPPVSLTVNNVRDLLEIEDEVIELTSGTPKVRVKVNHGDLGYATYPVVVGHFEANDIVNAEAVVDKHLNGELTRQAELGSYPGKIGEARAILNKTGYFEGAVVIGLGFNDRLTETALENSITRGLVELALQGNRCSCTPKAGRTTFGISPLLVGSSYGGLDVVSALKALLRAVNRVNEMFERSPVSGLQPFTEVEIIELYLDKAIAINKALLRIVQDGEFRRSIEAAEFVVKGTGGLTRISEGSNSSWWHRLQITEEEKWIQVKDEGEVGSSKIVSQRYLKYVSLADKARAEVEIHDLDRNLIQVMLAQSVGKSNNNHLLSKALFELLMPHAFKGFADDMRNITLVLDDQTAEYPWELLNSSGDGSVPPIATKTGLIRQLHDPYYRPNVFYAAGHEALVIGDPICSPPFQQLPFAKVEAEQVSRMLGNDFGVKVELSVNEMSTDIVQKLLKQPYKIIHLSGHGDIDHSDVQKSGMVLSEDVFLHPGIVESLPKVPELVFINCCYLGAMNSTTENAKAPQWNKLAANLGTQFIRNGVKAVVAAGWAVDDRAAYEFAEIFYKSMFSGDDFGTAVQKARQYCYQEYPYNNTWGAYQCYGNPQYRIKRDGRRITKPKEAFVDRGELLVELQNLAVKVDSSGQRIVTGAETKIASLLRRGERWINDGKVLEAAAQCYFEIHSTVNALEFYTKAIDQIPHDISYRSRSNYLNLLVNRAIEETKEGEHSNANDLLTKAEKQVEILKAEAKSIQVLNELGGHFKRMVKVSDDEEEKLNHIMESAKCYSEAFELSKQTSLYALTNYIQVMAILQMAPPPKKGGNGRRLSASKIGELITKGQELVSSGDTAVQDFWTTIFEADLKVAELMIRNRMNQDQSIKLIEEAFEIISNTWKRGGSWRKLEVLKEHYGFLQEVSSSIEVSNSRKTDRNNVVKALDQLRIQLIELENQSSTR